VDEVVVMQMLYPMENLYAPSSQHLLLWEFNFFKVPKCVRIYKVLLSNGASCNQLSDNDQVVPLDFEIDVFEDVGVL
jgi:hypothetical protein